MAYVEFFFPGDVAPKSSREVESKDSSLIVSIMPQYAHSYRFENENTRYWVGKEYSVEDFLQKYPQLKDEEDLTSATRIVKTKTGGFYSLGNTDIVISA